MPKAFMRPKYIFDPETGPLPVGHTKFYNDYVEREGAGAFIPGTNVKRLKVSNLGPKARGVTIEEVERVVTELAALPHKPWRQARDRDEPAPARRQTARPRARARPAPRRAERRAS
jgi:hypothetical protein